jgi:exonuclease SbcD
MRLVHFSDTHLGFRQFERTNAAGVNQREADVAQSFTSVIDQTIALAPELVVIGGDVFHAVRPGNRAIVHGYRGLERLRKALPHTEVVMIAGNHDTPRSAESGGILGLFPSLGVHVVDGAPRVVELPALNCSVLAVPDNHTERPLLEPSSRSRYNVLLLHGETGGISPKGSPALAREISAEELNVLEWDYIALGHYHVYRVLAPNMAYSGAIDYTSSNAWGEHVEERAAGLAGKGIVERDLATGAQTFHALPRSREWCDLPAISARELGAAEINALIAEAVAAVDGGIDGKVVRLIAHDLDRQTARVLDHKMLREFRRRALSFQLIAERPEVVRVGISSAIGAALRRRAPLEELLADALRDHVLPADLDRAAFVALGTAVLAEATEASRIIASPVSEETVAYAQALLPTLTNPYEEGPVDALPDALRERMSTLAVGAA